MNPYSLYIHIPFCRHRCGYCDFNTYAGLEGLIPDYIRALCREIEIVARPFEDKPVLKTVYFGGGTPSLLEANQLGRILEVIHDSFEMLPEIEISLEANPGTLSLEYLIDLKQIGINRLSLGVQSTHPHELALLERQHDFLQVIQSVNWARRAGFENLNLDLIFGLPGQGFDAWKESVEKVLVLNPDHLSVYSLTLEHGTPMENWAAKGLIEVPDPDVAADMYEWVSERLERANYRQYEISNWAQVVDEVIISCQHNLQYWHNLPYFGVGAGAHGYVRGIRTANVLSPLAFIQRCLKDSPTDPMESGRFALSPAAVSFQDIDRETEMNETMMMGLRLVIEGVSDQNFRSRFGVTIEEHFGSITSRFVSIGLLEWSEGRNRQVRLTKHGRLLANQVFREFV